jgi:uncharacterized protein YacL
MTALFVLRFVFCCVAVGVSTMMLSMLPKEANQPAYAYGAFFGIMLIAIGVIAVDILLPRKRIETVSAVYFGLLVGMLLTYVLSIALTPVLSVPHVAQAAQLVIGMVLCYGCISVLLQTKDDFRFVIPYVEFVRETKGFKPLILDTSVIIDGRIEDLCETSVFDNQMIVPRFAVAELQGIADSSDRLRRARGRRGLDVLNRLRANDKIDLQIFDRELPEFSGQPVDMKLVLLAKHLEGKVVTGDFNLNKVAKIHNVTVINLNEIANSLKPLYLPGETFELRIVKPGEGQDQGVGYLDDGTMVVVEGGREQVGRDLAVSVTSTLQTNAGRMIFAKFDTPPPPAERRRT